MPSSSLLQKVAHVIPQWENRQGLLEKTPWVHSPDRDHQKTLIQTLRWLKHEGSWVEESWWIVGYIRHLPQKLIWMQYTMRGKVQETFPIQKSSWDFWPVVTNRSEKKKLELYRLRLSRFKSSFPSWSILKARSHMSSRSGPDSGAMKTGRLWCILS